ncbi:hypothetical protein [Clostridium frigidicarnis]|uniref:Uncharacterized protein n=1 Tax=Clostridium frigidicarnis TaxID=84698 RepID=A0A1I0V1J0_9CLOT|nr:hypothetical protein [Clostridium frigidicarnis]SFA70175.1 hypothetical protein SAMN04488528_100192 [Clostridium frigidicarnis]
MTDGFNFKELDEFNDRMLDFVNDYKTKETQKIVKKGANKLKSKERTMYKAMGAGLEHTDTKESAKIINNFKSGKPYKKGENWSCRAFNSASHAHLINNGFVHKPHLKKKGKKKSGYKGEGEKYIPGYHFIEKAAEQFEDEYGEMVEHFLSDMLKEEGLL